MVPINYYREIEPFAKYTDWCITIDELIFQQYGENGNNRLYVAIRDDMSYVPAIPGSSSPHDDYGYSLMAIYVRRDGKKAKRLSMMLNLKSFWEKNTMFYFKCLHIQNEAFEKA